MSFQKEKPNYEYEFALDVSKSPDWAVDDNGIQLFRWNGACYRPVSPAQFNSVAIEFLEINFGGREACRDSVVTSSTRLAAKKLVGTGMPGSQSRVIPPIPRNRSIIPFQDCWLEIDEYGSIMAIEPDRSVGIQ